MVANKRSKKEQKNYSGEEKDGEEMEREDKEKDVGIGDIIKRVVTIGVGAAFMTEDAVKNFLGDLPLPKNIISGLVQNAKDARTDFTKSITKEIKAHLGKVDPKIILKELVENFDLEIQAQVSFKKKTKKEKK